MPQGSTLLYAARCCASQARLLGGQQGCKEVPRRGGGGREEGRGRLGRPASCSPAAAPLPPMGDASVPTPLRTTPAPTDVTICPKKPTVESPCGRRVHLCGRNILVEVEQIGRVVALLERCQPC